MTSGITLVIYTPFRTSCVKEMCVSFGHLFICLYADLHDGFINSHPEVLTLPS